MIVFEVGDKVRSLIDGEDVVKGNEYKVVGVGAGWVDIFDDNEDISTLSNSECTITTTPDQTQYIRILETLAGDDIVDMARNIAEALRDG